jgi:hypothetical protein
VKIVYVAGFFSPVLRELRARMKKRLDERSVVWIPEFSNGDLDTHRFMGDFFDVVARGATHVLVLLFLFRAKEYLLDPVLNFIIDEGRKRSQNLDVRVERHKSARDAKWVIDQIEQFNPSVEIPLPSELDGLEEWVSERHGGKVLLHPRAVNAAKKSKYADNHLIYRAIDLLAVEYWEMKTTPSEGSKEYRQRLDARLQELGLELAASISLSRAGEEGDDYFVKYPVGTESNRMLDTHLKKGSDRDERFCLRIYFFWDEDSRKVVIGWLPSHLETRAT